MHPNMGCGWTSVEGISVMMIKLLNDAALFAGEVKFPIRQSCGENTKIGLRRVRRQLGGEKAIYIENTKINACF